MSRIFLGILIFGFLSCGTKKDRVVFQGDLKDLFIDSLSFEREVGVGFMAFLGTIQYKGEETIYISRNGLFRFFDPKTGRKVGEFQIPAEGPGSLKGGVLRAKAFNNSTLVSTNHTGFALIYKDEQLVSQFKLDLSDLESNTFFSFPMSGNALHQVSPGEFELTGNPFDAMAHRIGKDGFDLEFSSWILKFDEEGNWICKTDFKAPYDETYANSADASAMVRMVEKGESWAMFSYSDSLFRIQDCQIVDRRILKSITPVTYFPDKYEGDEFKGSWERPENGAINYRLIKDQTTGLQVRLTSISRRGPDPNVRDPHDRLYSDEETFLLLIYDSEWNLKGELKMVYPIGTRFENLFSTSEGLFINKPEQASEDEYEFYKIDLSRFVD